MFYANNRIKSIGNNIPATASFQPRPLNPFLPIGMSTPVTAITNMATPKISESFLQSSPNPRRLHIRRNLTINKQKHSKTNKNTQKRNLIEGKSYWKQP